MTKNFFRQIVIAAAIFVAGTSLACAAELNQQAQIDLLAAQLKDALIATDYSAALTVIEKLKNTGEELGVEIIYFEALALAETGKPLLALDTVSQYINAAGRDGRNYQDAIELYGQLDAKKEQLAEAERVRLAEEARRIALSTRVADNEAEKARKLGAIEEVRTDWEFIIVALIPGRDGPIQ